MSGGFQVVPESFPAAANRLREVAQGILDAWSPAREQAIAVRYGRGDDLLSPLIQVSLTSAVQLIDASMSTTAQHLVEVADALELMGGRYEQADVDLQQSLDALGGSTFDGPAFDGPAFDGTAFDVRGRPSWG